MFSAVSELESNYQKLVETVAYKEDLEGLKKEMQEILDARVKKMKKWVRELQEQMVSKDDFIELVTRVDSLETDKVSREELGRLLEPGFIDKFIQEVEDLRNDMDELKQNVSTLEENLQALIVRIDEEILPALQAAFDEIRASMAEMKEKLDTLDADDVLRPFILL
ncbi:uncharacterized protein CDAR_508831 [Caerostris darwini]|uniref:Uncharacterized protein n=1 Tax=Caerostris darwini TaxID=1538125 RepID=A0AAV4N0H9_9ARAC|nr:uncharacterized protein CDAR_508831 [Caerostris darwini]